MKLSVVADTIAERRCIFLGQIWKAEKMVAERMQTLATGKPSWPDIDADKAMPWVEQNLGVTLAASQREAVKMALSSKVMVITGGPGVGKTTLVNAILSILAVKDVSVALAAPTGRAAKRLSESTGMEAKTIHRLLEVDPRHGGFKRSADNPLDCDLLVVDEASMVDVPLMASLVRALQDKAALMVVGDVDQLPSVGPGQVLADIIDSRAVPVARLTEIFRQAARSQIITNAHMNRGGLGARALNVALQKALNPPVDGTFIERFGFTYRVGDKVMQTENDYDKEVFNGDMGYVRSIEPDAQDLVIEFDGNPVEYQFGELDQVSLAYAISIHKSQGSEYPAVVIPMMMQHYVMLRRNLLYTGITRGRKLVILVGQKQAVGTAVKGKVETRRWSKLAEWLAPSVRGQAAGQIGRD